MKKIISLLLVLLMVGAMVVSCGGGGGGGGEPDDTDKPPVDDTPGEGGDGEAYWYEDVRFPKGTAITIQLSDLDDKELTTGGKRYMEGPGNEISNGQGFEKVQNEVYKRNKDAKSKLNLTVNYEYIAMEWGAGISSSIQTSERSGKAPDLYCDMMYDMAGLSLQHEIFTNIMRYTQEDEGADGWKEGNGYFNIDDSTGYNKSLMLDMALTDDKMFLIASDYFVDVMRAMLVMPFNLDMYADYALPEGIEDDNATMLYALVEDGGWTWSELLKYERVYSGSGKASVSSDRMLMALSVSGLSSTGFVYSTAYKTYEYKKGVYTLKSECIDLVNAFKDADIVARSNAVACGEGTRGQPAGVEACKTIFTQGKALFAGPQMLGAVEEEAYTNMVNRLSIVPVPKTSDLLDYNTAINTRARVGAVSWHSGNKKAVSAWVQYCSEKSGAVRTEYFTNAMNGKYLAGSGADGMLQLIYNSIGDSKSMVIDHMLLYKNWADLHDVTWTQMISAGDFQQHATTISNTYTNAVKAKQEVLDAVLVDWENSDLFVS